MSGLAALAALLGVGVAAGVLIVIAGLRGSAVGAPGRRHAWRRPAGERATGRLAAAAGVGLGAGVVTGWPVAAVFAALGVWTLPALLGRDKQTARQLARIEAIATWTELVRDTLSAAAGLEQAVLATEATAPIAIRAEVAALAGRLRHGQRLTPALRCFAADLADPTADLVVAALVLASERHARDLGALLGSLATAAREQAGMRLRVAAGRARTRTSVRVVVATTLTLATTLAVFNHAYLTPYDTAFGQLTLLAIGLLFSGAFTWLSRMARITQPQRFLTHATPDVASPTRGGGR